MKTILVATDGSAGADRAVDYAAGLASAPDSVLVIANVIGAGSLPEAVMRRFTRAQNAWFHEALEAHSAEILQQARERARRAGAQAIRVESRNGDIALAILDLAREVDAEAVVIGKRGTGQVAGLLLGSVSQKLVSLGTRVVVVVP